MKKGIDHVMYHLDLMDLPEDIQAKIHTGEFSLTKARQLLKLTKAVDKTAILSTKGKVSGSKPATRTTKYYDQIRIISQEEGLRDTKAVSKAATLVKKGVKVEDAVEEAKADYAQRRSRERVASKALPPDEMAERLVKGMKDPRELQERILKQYPKLVQKLIDRGELHCPHCGDGALIWECCGRKIDEK